MFSAVSNLGAGGTPDVVLSDISNGVLYGCFAIAGLFAGGVNNGALFALSLRNRKKILISHAFQFWVPDSPCSSAPLVTHYTSDHSGGTSFCSPYKVDRRNINRSSSYSFQTRGTRWFLIFAGAVLGVSAALLWSAQGWTIFLMSNTVLDC